MKECNRRNYNNKISDEVKIEKIKKIMATIKNKELINTLLK
jgi:hypothetical protein